MAFVHTDAQRLGRTTQTRGQGQCGLFYWKDNSLVEKQRTQLRVLSQYYSVSLLRAVVVPMLKQTHRVSLRALDWLVTNFSKKHPVVYKTSSSALCPAPTIINLHTHYKLWLRTHKRRNFDMFRRQGRVFFDVDGVTYTTTVAQLNFFWWAIQYEVLEYALKHVDAIERDHTQAMVQSRAQMASTGKRRQLLTKPRATCFVYNIHMRL